MAQELFDILGFHSTKTTGITAPETYNTTDCEVVADLEAGTYLVGYSFEAKFLTKDKPLNFQLTGFWGNDVDDFSLSSTANEIGGKKNRTYFFPKTIATPTTVTHGIRFKDQNASGDITVDFCDVFISRVG